MKRVKQLKRVKGMRQLSEIRRASVEKIQSTLWETMVGVLEGRIECAEAHAVAMVADEQIHLLDEEAKSPGVEKSTGRDGFKRWVN